MENKDIEQQAEKYCEFNLNDTIYVKLNERGYQHLADDHNKYVGVLPSWLLRTAEHYKQKASPDGYSSFQAWEFMQKFGPVTAMGFQQGYDLNIRIKKSDAPPHLYTREQVEGAWDKAVEAFHDNLSVEGSATIDTKKIQKAKENYLDNILNKETRHP